MVFLQSIRIFFEEETGLGVVGGRIGLHLKLAVTERVVDQKLAV